MSTDSDHLATPYSQDHTSGVDPVTPETPEAPEDAETVECQSRVACGCGFEAVGYDQWELRQSLYFHRCAPRGGATANQESWLAPIFSVWGALIAMWVAIAVMFIAIGISR